LSQNIEADNTNKTSKNLSVDSENRFVSYSWVITSKQTISSSTPQALLSFFWPSSIN